MNGCCASCSNLTDKDEYEMGVSTTILCRNHFIIHKIHVIAIFTSLISILQLPLSRAMIRYLSFSSIVPVPLPWRVQSSSGIPLDPSLPFQHYALLSSFQRRLFLVLECSDLLLLFPIHNIGKLQNNINTLFFCLD